MNLFPLYLLEFFNQWVFSTSYTRDIGMSLKIFFLSANREKLFHVTKLGFFQHWAEEKEIVNFSQIFL